MSSGTLAWSPHALTSRLAHRSRLARRHGMKRYPSGFAATPRWRCLGEERAACPPLQTSSPSVSPPTGKLRGLAHSGDGHCKALRIPLAKLYVTDMCSPPGHPRRPTARRSSRRLPPWPRAPSNGRDLQAPPRRTVQTAVVVSKSSARDALQNRPACAASRTMHRAFKRQDCTGTDREATSLSGKPVRQQHSSSRSHQ